MDEFEVHSTLANTSGLPTGVINHGIITPEQYAKLLSRSQVGILLLNNNIINIHYLLGGLNTGGLTVSQVRLVF